MSDNATNSLALIPPDRNGPGVEVLRSSEGKLVLSVFSPNRVIEFKRILTPDEARRLAEAMGEGKE